MLGRLGLRPARRARLHAIAEEAIPSREIVEPSATHPTPPWPRSRPWTPSSTSGSSAS